MNNYSYTYYFTIFVYCFQDALCLNITVFYTKCVFVSKKQKETELSVSFFSMKIIFSF